MGYVLYGDKGSGAFCVEAALAEAGAEYEFKIVSLAKDEQKSPEFLAVNPSGKIPALKLPSGEIVTETVALLLTIAERHPEAALLPPDRAQALRWIAFLASEVYPMVEIYDYPARFASEGGAAEALKHKALDRVRERMLVVERAVAGPWLLTSGFSAADLYVAMFSRWQECRLDGWREAHLPKICAIATALSERPAIAAVWKSQLSKRISYLYLGVSMTSRRAVIAGGAGAAVLAALGYRVWDRGVFSAGEGPAYEPWKEWQGHAGEGSRRPLHAAILAASAHNTQPWIFEPQDDSITVYADRARNLGSFDPFRREMHFSLGCAIANLQLAAFRSGLGADIVHVSGRLEPKPSNEPTKVSEIKLRQFPNVDTPTGALDRIADAIPHRHTNRGPYIADKAIAPDLLKLLFGKVGSNIDIIPIHDAGARKEMGATIVDATRRIVADKRMSEDSARWFRTGRREILARRDGVTTDTAGLLPLMTAASKLMPDVSAQSADDYWLAATRDVQVPTAPIFGMVMVRDRLDMAQALWAGYAWQMLHLAATVHGIAAQPLNQPMEMVDRNAMLGRPDIFKSALMKLAGLNDWEPTFVFRLGYAERPALPSPRRPLEDVIRRTGFA